MAQKTIVVTPAVDMVLTPLLNCELRAPNLSIAHAEAMNEVFVVLAGRDHENMAWRREREAKAKQPA